MRALQKIDNLSTGILLGSALGASALDRKSNAAKGLYGVAGAAALYKIARAIGPKPKYERRTQAFDEFMEKIESYLKQVADYKKQAAKYGPKMEEMKKKGYKQFKSLPTR